MSCRKSIFLVCLVLITGEACFSQTTSNVVVIESGMPLNNIGLIGKEVPSGSIVGTQYLFDDWVSADILINDQKLIRGVDMNYDLVKDEIDILFDGSRKFLPKAIISNFRILSTQQEYYWQNIDDKSVLVLEVVESKYYDLLEETFLLIKDPTYNVALDMGSRDTQIVRRTNFWIRDGNGSISKVINSKRKNLEIFNIDGDLKKFIKDNNLTWKSRSELIEIVNFANSHPIK